MLGDPFKHRVLLEDDLELGLKKKWNLRSRVKSLIAIEISGITLLHSGIELFFVEVSLSEKLNLRKHKYFNVRLIHEIMYTFNYLFEGWLRNSGS